MRRKITRLLLLAFTAWMIGRWVGCHPVDPYPLMLYEDRSPTLKNIDWQIYDTEEEGPLWRDTQ